MATGLVVNEKTNIRAPYYRQARAMCNALFSTGEFHFGSEMRCREPKDGSTLDGGNISQLRGILSHICYVKRYQGKHKEQSSSNGIERLVDRFVSFDKFHSLSKPLVVCEGKTDNIYLECALKSLAGDFPNMIEVVGSKIEWKIGFFKYSGGNMSIRGMSGGVGGLVWLINQYKNLMESFRCPGQYFPVIIVADNDKGAKNIKKEAARFVEREIDGTTGFYRLVYNLYLVLLPRECGEEEVAIEDYFEKSVLQRKVDGKSFSREDRFDTRKEYGKKIFAERVVRAGQAGISFERFRPLLEHISEAIGHYAKVNRDGD